MLSVQLSIIKLVFKNRCVVKARFCPLDSDNINFSAKKFKFAMLIKLNFPTRAIIGLWLLILPINPLCPVVHNLYFLSDNVFSIR